MGLELDRASFDALVLRHLGACGRFAVRLTGDVDVAEEVVQEAMVKAARGWKGFRGEAKFQTWMFRIVINVWRDRRGKSGGGEELQEVEDRRGGGPLLEAEAGEMGEAVAREVSGLPARQREVVVMIVYEGMEVREVAGVLGVSEQNVRVNLHYGRERLRERLRAYLPEEQRRERR